MNSNDDVAREGPRAGGRPAADGFLETRLHRAPEREDWVRRPRLMDRMSHASRQPVTLIAAPPGYGKTTLVAQWHAEMRPRGAWLSLDRGDNDPQALWTHVAAALDRAGCAVPTVPQPASASGSLLAAIVEALAAMTEDIVVVLDDFHFIQNPDCHDEMELLIEHLPPQAHLQVITRSDPGLRLGRLRASGGLVEIRADELAFSTEETRTLLAEEDLDLDDTSVELLLQRTEGWPAGLFLAILSMNDRSDPAEFVRSFSGGNRFVVDYLVEEVLSQQPPETREFITTVSILDKFSVALCDHVAGITGSAALLDHLERINLFLVSLDGDRTWFRFHHLFAAVARSELEISQPERLQGLHARAADWFAANGYVDEAVQHWIAAGRSDLAAMIVHTHWLQYVDAGRTATIQCWLDSIGPSSDGVDVAAGVTAAWVAALDGDETVLQGHLLALEPYRHVGPLLDGARSVESAVSMIQGLFGYGGPVEMMAGAERAVALETDHRSPFHALANLCLGHAAYVAGDLHRAVAPLTSAWRNDQAPVVIQALALATEALVVNELTDVDRSRSRAEQAMELLESHELGTVPQVSLVYTALGQAQADAGKSDDALATLDRGLLLRRATRAHGPWGTLHHLLVYARVAARAGRPELARELLGELDERLRRFSEGMGAMHARAAVIRRLIQEDLSHEMFSDRLTDREVDILRQLQRPMSLHEIAAELYLSANTVKTHTQAVYRKLDAHTRAEAVLKGRERLLI